MFKNFIKTAFRNITRHKGFSFINISGLTLGLAACILIGLFVYDEYNYDKFIPGGEQVYRVYNHYTNSDGADDRAVAPPMIATSLQQDFPEVETVTRVMMLPQMKVLFEAGKTKLYEESGYLVDSTFFEVFPLHFAYGSPDKALDNTSCIVLSTQMAERFFGSQNPVGRQIVMNKQPYTVKGVFEKNDKFHLQCNYMVTIATAQLPAERMKSWTWQQFYNYAKLKPGTNVQALEAKFQQYVHQKSAPAMRDAHTSNNPVFQPLANVHLYSAGFKFNIAGGGNITYVRALTIIACFILLIACFNFINLATAKSLQRAKEVGVRKSVGAGKKQLMLQFIGETVLLSYISILLSVLLVMLLLPGLNQFTGKHIALTVFANPVLLLLLLGLGLLTGIIAGFYPAVILSAFMPAKVLKGSAAGNEQAGRIPWLRHSLVVIQFTLSALLIISSVIIFKQVSYLHKKDLGFNKEQIMFFPMRGDKMFNNPDEFKNQLLRSPGVSAVSIGYGFPGDAVAGDEILYWHNNEYVKQSATQLAVDYDYIKTLGLTVIAGRDFDKLRQTDKDDAFIINETAVKQLGYNTPEKAIGQKLAWNVWGGPTDSLKKGTVIGVVKDFNYKSLYDKVEPAVLQIFPGAAWKVAVKIKTAGIATTMTGIENIWARYSPDYPLEYNFLDENFSRMYQSEDKLQSLVWIFTSIAVFIGCMGLFGLAAYTTERRRKEIGIRKVLGASTQNIMLLLSKSFVQLVVISLIIASPLAFWCMHNWLQNFAYRVNINAGIFVITGAVVLAIAFVTVSIQAIKAAVANPVKSIRTE